MLGFVSWVLGFVFWVLGFVFWVLGLVFWVLGLVFWVLGLVFWVLGLVFWVLGFVFWVLGIVSWLLGLVFWVLGLVFWVLGLVFWAPKGNFSFIFSRFFRGFLVRFPEFSKYYVGVFGIHQAVIKSAASAASPTAWELHGSARTTGSHETCKRVADLHAVE